MFIDEQPIIKRYANEAWAYFYVLFEPMKVGWVTVFGRVYHLGM